LFLFDLDCSVDSDVFFLNISSIIFNIEQSSK
ncbi:hypothetical protein CEXT_82331, partial [Caerostris extrusa]